MEILYATNYGGFDGFVSKMKYFNYAVPIWKVIQLFNMGPSNGYHVPIQVQNHLI